jgi:hypothetical protein
MRRRIRPWTSGQGGDVGHSFFGGTGWLFADLMMALAVVFLVATTVGFPAPSKPAAAHHPATKKPAAKHAEAALYLHPVKITITNLDYNGLLNNSPIAINSVRNKILGNASLRSRRAGLVLLFDGADSTDISAQTFALSVDGKIQRILQSLGARNIIFQVAVYNDYLNLANPPSDFYMDVYLFKTS